MARKRPAGVTIVRQAAQLMMASGFTPDRAIKAMRPRELAYMCDMCDTLRGLRLCDDVFFDDEEDEDDAQTDN